MELCISEHKLFNVGWVIRPVKTVGCIPCIVLVQTLNPDQSINQLTLALKNVNVMDVTI